MLDARKLRGLLRLAQHLAAFGGSSGQLRIEFTSANRLHERVDDLRQCRKLTRFDGDLVLGKFDGLAGVANAEEHLAVGIGEPALTHALGRFDLDADTFGILLAHDMRQSERLTGDLRLGHLLLLGERRDHLFPRTLDRIDGRANWNCGGELEGLEVGHAAILSETVERVLGIQPSAKRASEEYRPSCNRQC